jgi:hypothetical protein
MSETFGKLPTGPRSRESADYLIMRLRLRTSPKFAKPFGVVTHRHNISDIAKKPALKDRAFIELFQAVQSIPILRRF